MQKEITVPELLAKLDRGEPVLLLDVRNEEEFGSWRFEGKHSPSAINIPYFAFLEEPEATLARVPAQGAGEWTVLCAKGGSSEYVADLLREAGIPARNIVGGMLALDLLVVNGPLSVNDTLVVRELPGFAEATSRHLLQLQRDGVAGAVAA